MNAEQVWSLSIDFGTTNTSAAYYRPHDPAPHVIRLGADGETIPSAVIVDPARIIVGEAAINERQLYPAEFRSHPKLELGKDYIYVGASRYPTIDVVGAVLRHVRDRALEANEHTEPGEVVLTHPADWGDRRKDALRDSATRAGFALEVIRLVEEPVAAAHYYGASAGDPAIGERIAVFDFGGGTLDVAIIERVGAGIGYETQDSDGDPDLGGKDFDELLYQWALTQLTLKTGMDMAERLSRPENLAMQLTLRDSVRKAKESLSTIETVKIPVAVPGFNDALIITGDEYRQMIGPLVHRGVELTKAIIGRGGGHVDRIYLTGGSSRTPLIRSSLHEALRVQPRMRDNLKTVVVEGALWVPKGAGPPEPQLPSEQLTLEEAAHGGEQGEGEHLVGAADQNARPEPAEAEATKKKRRARTIGGSVTAAAVIAIFILVIVNINRPDPVIVAEDCSLGEVWDSDFDSCVPDTTNAEDCVGGEVWDPVGKVCLPGEEETIACWDGSEAASSSACPAFEGEEALSAGFKVSGNASCVTVDTAAAEGLWVGLAEEAIQCSWNDLPYTLIKIARYSPSGATEFWNSGVFHEDLAVDGETWWDTRGNAVGTTWDATFYDANANPQWMATIYSYEDLPTSAEVFTDIAGGGTMDDVTEGIRRLIPVSADSVETILAGMP